MAAKTTRPRIKHIPQRTCVGCRQVQSKRELIRIVRTPEGVLIEKDKRLAGRGAYLHALPSCWEKGIPAAISRALRTNLSSEELIRLQSFLTTLPVVEDRDSIEKVKA